MKLKDYPEYCIIHILCDCLTSTYGSDRNDLCLNLSQNAKEIVKLPIFKKTFKNITPIESYKDLVNLYKILEKMGLIIGHLYDGKKYYKITQHGTNFLQGRGLIDEKDDLLIDLLIEHCTKINDKKFEENI